MSKPNVNEMKAKKDVKGLLEVLKHSRIIGTSIYDSFGALDMIVEIGADAVEPLIEALDSDKDEVVRWVSANALGRIGDKKALEPLIKALKNDVNPDVRWHAAESLGELGEEKAVEALTNALEDKDDWVRNFAASALKKIREALGLVGKERTMPRAEPEVPAKVPLRVKPASERTRQLPKISSFDELRTFIEKTFTPREYKPKYDWMKLDYWMTPEELCDIVEKYADLIEVQFSEYSCPKSEDLCCVMLFQKNPPEGGPIELIGLFPFGSADDAISYLRSEYGSDPDYDKILPKLAGIQGKYQLNFGRGYENPRDTTYEKDKDINPHDLWNRIYARRKRLGIPEPAFVGSTEPATKEPEIPASTALVEDIVAGLQRKTSSRPYSELGFDRASNFSEGLACVQIGSKFGFIDKTGKIAIEPQFDFAFDFSEGLAEVGFGSEDRGKRGFIDKTGKIVIEAQFDFAFGFSEGLAIVMVKDEQRQKWGFINKAGKMVKETICDYIYPFSEGLAEAKVRDKWGFIDKTGEVVITPTFVDSASFSEGLACVKVGTVWGFIDKTGEVVITPTFVYSGRFSEGLACVEVGSKVGFIDKTGKMVIEPQFDLPAIFSEGLACVQIGPKKGFIDKTGKMVIEPQFGNLAFSINDFREGMASITVEFEGFEYKMGFIDKTGRIVIEPQFKGPIMAYFSEGLACVEIGHKDVFIDKTGKIVITRKVTWGEARIVKEGVVLLGSMELYVPVGDEKNAVDAWNGVSLGSEADELVAEILRIGHEDGFLSVCSGGKFDEERKHIRAREIGERLYDLGGRDLQIKAWWRVEIEKYRSGLRESRSLESCWDLD